MPPQQSVDLNPKTTSLLKRILPGDVYDSIRYYETVIEYDQGKKNFRHCVVTGSYLYLIPLNAKDPVLNPTISFSHVHEVLLKDHGARIGKDGANFLEENLSANSFHIVLTFFKDNQKKQLGEMNIFTFVQDSKAHYHIEETWKTFAMAKKDTARQPAKERGKTLDMEQLRSRFRDLENELIVPDKQDDVKYKTNLIEELHVAATRHLPLRKLFFESELIFSFIIEDTLFFLTPVEFRSALFLRQSVDGAMDKSSSTSTSPRALHFRKQRMEAMHRIAKGFSDTNSSGSTSRSIDAMSISQVSAPILRGPSSRPASVLSTSSTYVRSSAPVSNIEKQAQLERIERNTLRLPPLGLNSSIAATKLAESIQRQAHEPFVTPDTITRPSANGRKATGRKPLIPIDSGPKRRADPIRPAPHVPVISAKQSPALKPAPPQAIPRSTSNSSSLAATYLPKLPTKNSLPPLPPTGSLSTSMRQRNGETGGSIAHASVDLTTTFSSSDFGDLTNTSGDQLSRTGMRSSATGELYRPPTGLSNRPPPSPNISTHRSIRPYPPSTPAGPPSIRSSVSHAPSDRAESSLRRQVLPPLGLSGVRESSTGTEKDAAIRAAELQYIISLLRLVLYMLRGSDNLSERLNLVKRPPPCTINEFTQALLTVSDYNAADKGPKNDVSSNQTSLTRLIVSVIFEVIDGIFRQAKTEKVEFRLQDYLLLITNQPFFLNRLSGFVSYLIDLFGKCSTSTTHLSSMYRTLIVLDKITLTSEAARKHIADNYLEEFKYFLANPEILAKISESNVALAKRVLQKLESLRLFIIKANET